MKLSKMPEGIYSRIIPQINVETGIRAYNEMQEKYYKSKIVLKLHRK